MKIDFAINYGLEVAKTIKGQLNRKILAEKEEN